MQGVRAFDKLWKALLNFETEFLTFGTEFFGFGTEFFLHMGQSFIVWPKTCKLDEKL